MSELLMLEHEFYSAPFSFSYSSLNRLLYAPSVFYKEYVLKMKEIKTDQHLIEGKLTHYLLGDESSFDDKFVIIPEELPTGNTKEVVDVVYTIAKQLDGAQNTLVYYQDAIIETLRVINLHQKLVDDKKADKDGIMKTGDQKRLEKIINSQTMAYFEFLKSKGSRDLIDTTTLQKCNSYVEAVKANERASAILGLNLTPSDTLGIYNELPIEIPGEPFGIKGIIDNLIVDVENKRVSINDIKTSNKSVADFSESVDYWNYWLQAAMYDKLVRHFLKDVIDDTWTVDFYFIVIDKYLQVYPYRVSKDTMTTWKSMFEKVLKEAEYHYTSRNYSLPYQFITEDVEL